MNAQGRSLGPPEADLDARDRASTLAGVELSDEEFVLAREPEHQDRAALATLVLDDRPESRRLVTVAGSASAAQMVSHGDHDPPAVAA